MIDTLTVFWSFAAGALFASVLILVAGRTGGRGGSMGSKKSEPRIVWAEPLRQLARDLGGEAATLHALPGSDPRAELLDAVARRLASAVEAAATGEWVTLEDAAPLFSVKVDSIRARCRRRLAAEGLARKDGAGWMIHVSALPAAA